MYKIITADLNKAFSDARKGTPFEGAKERMQVGATRPVMANQLGFNAGMYTYNGADVNPMYDFFDNPLIKSSNLYLPYDRIQLNAWLRYWDSTHPLLGAIIDLHSTYPFSRFEYAAVDDSAVQDIYQTAHDRVKLFRRILEMAREYWLIGEFLVFKSWNNDLGIWESLHLLDPDTIEIDGDIVIDPEDLDYYWSPPEVLKDIVNQLTPYADRMRKKLAPEVLTAIQTGSPIPLDKFSLSHVARRANPFQPRGQSIVTRCIKTLQYEEDLISAQRQIAKRHIFPLQIYKIGDIANNYIPSDDDLDAFRQVLMSVASDPNKAIIYHDALNVEFQGTSSQLLDIDREFERIETKILSALFCNKAFVTGEGPCSFCDTTEVLTENGWKFYDKVHYEKGEKIATLNRETGSIEYQVPVGIALWNYTGEVVHFDHDWVKADFTGNHRCLAQKISVDGGDVSLDKMIPVLASDIVSSLNNERIKYSVPNIGNFEGSLSSDFIEVIENNPYITVPEVKRKKLIYPSFKIKLDMFLELLGLYLSEGSIYYFKREVLLGLPRVPWQVMITKNKFNKDGMLCDDWERINVLLESSGLPFRYRLKSKVKATAKIQGKGICGNFEIRSPGLACLFSKLGSYAQDKYLPSWVLGLPKRYLSILMCSLMTGDGISLKTSNACTYLTSSKSLADGVQILAMHLGYPVKISERDYRFNGITKKLMYAVRFYSEDHSDFLRSCRKNIACINPRIGLENISIEQVKNKRVFSFETPSHSYFIRVGGIVHLTLNTYNNATVAARMLSSRYITMRHLMEEFIRDDFCKPIAIAHDMYVTEKKDVNARLIKSKKAGRHEVSIESLTQDNESFFLKNGKFVGSSVRYKGNWYKVESRTDDGKVVLSVEDARRLNIPDIKWHSKINLVDDMENKQLLMNLFEQGRIPFKIVAQALDLNEREVEKAMIDEKDTMFDPFVQQTLKTAADNQENSAAILDAFNARVVKKAKERGLEIDTIFPKLPDVPEEANNFNTKAAMETDFDKLPIEGKIKKLSILSALAKYDPEIQASLKTVRNQLAKQLRIESMKEKPNLSLVAGQPSEGPAPTDKEGL